MRPETVGDAAAKAESDAKLLAHEQRHFDIGQIYALKMKVVWEQFKRNSACLCAQKNEDGWKKAKSQTERKIKNLLKSHISFQKQYDNATEHGAVPEKQEQYETAIKKQIADEQKNLADEIAKKAKADCPPPPSRAVAPPPPATDPPPKTATSTNGISFTPWIGGGVSLIQKDSFYTSTGVQPPSSASSSITNGQFGIGIAVGGPQLQVPVFSGLLQITSVSFDFGLFFTPDANTLFATAKHLNGVLALTETDRIIFEPMVKFNFSPPPASLDGDPTDEVMYAPKDKASARVRGNPLAKLSPAPSPWVFSVGIGPTFRQSKLDLSSDQTAFGGGAPSTSATAWQSGLVLGFSAMRRLCTDCVAGNALLAGIDTRLRWYPSQAVNLRSPAFGFTETGSVAASTNQTIMLKLAVPLMAR